MVVLLTDYFNLALERVRLVFRTTIDVLVRHTVSCSANKNNAHAVAAHSVLVNDILHCSFIYGPHLQQQALFLSSQLILQCASPTDGVFAVLYTKSEDRQKIVHHVRCGNGRYLG